MPVEAPIYPVGLVVRGKRCLVVGGGPVAARKAAGLVAAGAEVTVVAKKVSPEMKAVQGLAGVAERPYRPGDVAGHWLVMVATGDSATNQAVFDDAEAAGVWANSADDPERCSFVLPAVARQGPVSVAVSTSGYSPALASWLRAHAAEHMGPELAELAEMLAAARDQLKAEGRSTEDVDWRPALSWAMLDLIRQGRQAEAKRRLDATVAARAGTTCQSEQQQ